ncbi:MAG: Na/Pi cotransporter family protein [Bacteroidales bacterium]|nr:Na/Pi cotransporter family protein [Bacteroidales bacterium]
MTATEIILLLLKVIGAVVIFIYGMTLMSEGLQKMAGSRMRNILGRMTKNPVSGILTGTAVTAAIQSSSATTVMVVSFVNSGLLSLAGAIAVVMGANIGTTITSWIILLGMGGGMEKFMFPLILCALALPFMISKRSKTKAVSEFVIGLAILLVGLQFLQDAIPDLSTNQALLSFMGSLSNSGFLSILLFVAIGALLTAIVQSSSASMAITLVMCANQWIGFDVAIALVMGQNIGTTITANIAAAVTNANGKKTARAHFLFNLIGTVITLILFYPVTHLIAYVTESFTGADVYSASTAEIAAALPLAITLFHTLFNVVNTVILAFFIPWLIKIVNWMVKTPPEEAEMPTHLKFISGGYLNTAELNLQSAQSEIEEFSKRVLRMYTFLPEMDKADDKHFDELLQRVQKYEGITDRMEIEIAQFLTKVSEGDLSLQSSQRISSMLRIVDNLESIGDAIYQMAILKKNKREQEITLGSDCITNLDHMYRLVEKSLQVMDYNLHQPYDKLDLSEAYAAENAVNSCRDTLRSQHLDAIKAGAYSYQTGTTYSGMYALYEKIGDYVINVSEGINIGKSQKIAEHHLTPAV